MGRAGKGPEFGLHPVRDAPRPQGADADAAVKASLSRCLLAVTGGAEPTLLQLAPCRASKNKQSVCGAVWKRGNIAYRCLDCEVDANSAVCVDCFRAADHEGHDYRIVHINGGCCDCGNPNAWRPSGFCPCHGVPTNADGTPAFQPELPPQVRANVDAMLAVAMRRLARDAARARAARRGRRRRRACACSPSPRRS